MMKISMLFSALLLVASLTTAQTPRLKEAHTFGRPGTRLLKGTAFSPESRFLITQSSDGTVRLRTGEGKFIADLGDVLFAGRSFAPDESAFVVVTDDTVPQIVRTTGKLGAKLVGHTAYITDILYSPDGQYIATASGDSTVRLWDKNGKLVRMMHGFRHPVRHLEFSPGGGLLMTLSGPLPSEWGSQSSDLTSALSLLMRSGSEYEPNPYYNLVMPEDDTVELVDSVVLWRYKSGERAATIEERQGHVEYVRFSPDNEYLLTLTESRTNFSGTGIKISSNSFAGNRVCRRRLDGSFVDSLGEPGSNVVRMNYSRKGKDLYLVTASSVWSQEATDMLVLNADDGDIDEIDSLIRYRNNASQPGYQSLDIRYEQTTQDLRRIFGFQLTMIESERYSRANLQYYLREPGDDDRDKLEDVRIDISRLYNANISPDGEYFILTTKDGNVGIWETDGDLVTDEFDLPDVLHKHYVYDAAFSPDGYFILTASEDSTARILKRSGEVERVIEHPSYVNSCDYSPDGQRLITSCGDSIIRLWQSDGTLITEMSGHNGMIGDIRFSHDGNYILSASLDGTVRLWESDGTLKRTITDHDAKVYAGAFAPDDSYFVTAGGDKVSYIYDPQGNLTDSLKGHNDAINGVAISANGKYIGTACADGTARIWDTAGNTLQTLLGHEGYIANLCFSPDSKYVATAGADGTIRLWTVADGEEAFKIEGHHSTVYSLEFSEDGRYLVTTGLDNTVRLWELTN